MFPVCAVLFVRDSFYILCSGCVRGKNRMEKKKRKGLDAYFTVEAALIMPIVLGCYCLIIHLLCFSYERCIWEQNGYRLPVWMEYVEGFGGMNTEKREKISKETICRYVLAHLEDAEKEAYIFGRNAAAQLQVRGEFVTVTRTMEYTPFSNGDYEMRVKELCLEPTDYIRTTKMLKNKMNQEEGNEDDQK